MLKRLLILLSILITCTILAAFVLLRGKWEADAFRLRRDDAAANLPLDQTGEAPKEGGAGEVPAHFVDVALESGITFRHHNGAKGPPTIIETMTAGLGFCDYDDDGDLDLYVLQSGAVNKKNEKAADAFKNAFYQNDGAGRFKDIALEAGVADTGYGMGCVFGDYDNDGDKDLYVTNYGKNALYRNEGDGRFSDVTAIAGVGYGCYSTCAAFADYDNDGDLDLYVTNYAVITPESKMFCYIQNVLTHCPPWTYKGEHDVLYRNNGDGAFTDVTKSAGIDKTGRGFGVVFTDYDNDGDVDIYAVNDQNENLLFRNNGDPLCESASVDEDIDDNVRFEETALLSGVAYMYNGNADSGMGVDAADYDNDGYIDLIVTNYQNSPDVLYHNDGLSAGGDVTFTDVSHQAGIGIPSLKFLGFGTQFFDYDNDGYLDIFIAHGHVLDNANIVERPATYEQLNQLFRNNRDGTFTEVTSGAGPGLQVSKVSRGAAFGDYDNDGDVDVAVSNCNDTVTLLRNDGGSKDNYLVLKVVSSYSNRDGIGARVRVTADDLSQIREAKTGSSYMSDNDARLIFGLEHRKSVDKIEVRWPSGRTEAFENIAANQFLIVEEGRGIRMMRDP